MAKKGSPESEARIDSEPFNDPATYRELTEPHANSNAASDAYEGFVKELKELRKKYRIPDLAWSALIRLVDDDGTEGTCMVYGNLGDHSLAECLTAFAWGKASGERQKRVSDVLKQAARVTLPQ